MKKVRNSKGLRSKVASSADPAGPTPKPEAPGSNPGRRTKKEHHPLGWCSFLAQVCCANLPCVAFISPRLSFSLWGVLD